MVETLLIALLVLVTGTLIVSIILLTRNSLSDFDKQQERMERSLKEEMTQNRGEASLNAKQLREEIVNSMTKISNLQKDQLDIFSTQLTTLTRTNEQKLDKMRETVEERLKILQEDNTKKLDQMRETVDEKLHATLEKRLGESFKLVSERLEMVHKGLGEMQSLAVGVGDLKKVLSNVKTRGILGEIQLGNILEQLLTPDQYAKNVITKEGSRENVEFAIKLPGKNDSGKVIYLPLDSKFPLEHYHSLVDAYEHGDNAAIEEATKLLENTIKKCAKEVRDKYIDPPNTTDFGIMFLPVEGLYAEVTRRTSLIEVLQRDFKIIITGPTTLAAILNSLQMGFRTLAVEKRSSEVWMLLGAVKTEFGKFGDILEKTQKKLQEASNTIEGAAKKSRTIERRLKDVQGLPSPEAVSLLGDIEETE
ncbi:MAG: DNA recombination protein RmuC [Thermodesulfovibrionia bacterium]|nr:DNA recombination protein RmuC [Thermodesulfovibrionia bacterium]